MTGGAGSGPSRIFISHSGKDASFVGRLVETLVSAEISCWYSERHIKGAQQWHDEIGRALETCDWFLIVLSPAAVESVWVKRELLYALNTDRYAERIVPVLMQDCDMTRLSWTLPSLQYVDFRSDFGAGRRGLLRALGKKPG